MHETIGGNPVVAIIIVIIVIIITVGGGWYFTMGPGKKSNTGAFDPVAECESIGGQYNANSGTCVSTNGNANGNMELDPVTACAGIGGVYNVAAETCDAPVVEPDPVNPASACQDIGGQYDATTGQCLSGPIPPDPRQTCVDAGGVYNAETQDCVPAVDILDTEEECRNAGRIWDGQAFECITDAEAQARCAELGGHWNTTDRRCVYCTANQDYNTATGACVTRPQADPEAECIAAGNVWNIQDQACYLSETRTAELQAAMAPACYDVGMTIDFDLGVPDSTPPYCVSCDTKYAGSIWDAGERNCIEAGAQPVLPPPLPAVGRYVRLERVQASGDTTASGNTLNIAEIIINGPNGNRLTTVTSPITQSSVWTARDRAAKYVLDADLATFLHTASYPSEPYLESVWTEIDLGSDSEIADVIVENRRHSCCKARAKGLRIRIIDGTGNDVYVSDPITTVQNTYVFDTIAY